MRVYVIKRNDNSYMSDMGFADFVQSIHLAKFFDNYEWAKYECPSFCKIVPVEIKEIKQPIRLLPCICGSKYRQLWNTINNSYYYKCSKCGLQTPNVKTKIRLKEIWNEMIKEKMEKKDENN